jgi:hypothetical protein
MSSVLLLCITFQSKLQALSHVRVSYTVLYLHPSKIGIAMLWDKRPQWKIQHVHILK